MVGHVEGEKKKRRYVYMIGYEVKSFKVSYGYEIKRKIIKIHLAMCQLFQHTMKQRL